MEKKKIKRRIFEIIEVASEGDLPSKIFDIFIIILISLNIIAVVLESIKELSYRYESIFWAFETLSVIIFTIEYILRLWTCDIDKKFRGITGRIKYAIVPLAIIDLIAILPFYIPMVVRLDLRFMRAIRLLRLLRVLKMGRYSESLKILGNVVRTKKEELIMTTFIILIILTISSSLMYLAENDVQPEVFPNIPSAMWWGIITLTTVGYGDTYPITPVGKLLGAIIAILGIGVFALPAGILCAGFMEEIQKKREKKSFCPYCGKRIDEY